MIRNQELGNLIKEALIEQDNTNSKKIKNSQYVFNESLSIFLVTIPDEQKKVNFKSNESSPLYD